MLDFFKQVYTGKTLGRILFNYSVKKNKELITGKILDIAGGSCPSYLKFFGSGVELIHTDINGKFGVDMNKPLPFGAEEFDSVVFFNALYIAEEPQSIFYEIYRVLKEGGVVLISSPFMMGEMPEPHDYARFTTEKIELMLEKANLHDIQIYRLGGRFSSAVNLLHSFFVFNTVRAIVYALALIIDKLTIKFQKKYPAPILYFITANK